MVRKLEDGEVQPSKMTRRDKITMFDAALCQAHAPGAGKQVAKFNDTWDGKWDISKEQFLENVSIEGDCWVWTGVLNEAGLPAIVSHGFPLVAVRVGWIIFKGGKYNGYIPRNYWLVNGCGNPLCVSPRHAELLYIKRPTPDLVEFRPPSE